MTKIIVNVGGGSFFWAAVTNLEHPGSGLRSVFQETSSLFAWGFLQPTLVVHLCQALWAPDLSAGRLVIWPNAVQSHLSSPATDRVTTGNLATCNKSFSLPDQSTKTFLLWPLLVCHSPVKPLPLGWLDFIIRVHNDLFASEVDDLVKVQSRHVHLTMEEDRAVTYEGQSKQH